MPRYEAVERVSERLPAHVGRSRADRTLRGPGEWPRKPARCLRATRSGVIGSVRDSSASRGLVAHPGQEVRSDHPRPVPGRAGWMLAAGPCWLVIVRGMYPLLDRDSPRPRLTWLPDPAGEPAIPLPGKADDGTGATCGRHTHRPDAGRIVAVRVCRASWGCRIGFTGAGPIRSRTGPATACP